MIGLEFEVVPALDEEECLELLPCELVQRLSYAKACEVSKRLGSGKLIIGADTMVSIGGRVLGKPRDRAHAKQMLEMLSGATHKVYTGITVICGGTVRTECEETSVHFRDIMPGEIEAYLKTGDSMDKAGAYGIQGKAALFIRGIDGDFYNVMGLPLCRLYKILLEFGAGVM